MRQLFLAALLTVGSYACNTTGGDSALMADPLAVGITGCYAASGHTGPRSSPLAGTDRICIDYTPDGRSGDYSFRFMSQGALLNTVGASLSEAQPRCPNCFDFRGIDGNVEFRGERPETTTLSVGRNAASSDSFALVREQGGNGDDNGVGDVLPIIGCYAASGHTGSRSSPLAGTDGICIDYTPNSRGGDYSFRFLSRGTLLTTVGGSLAPAQPRCPNCYDFQGVDGIVEYRGERPEAMTLRVGRNPAFDQFNIVRVEGDAGDNSEVLPIVGCYTAGGRTGVANSALVAANRVCIEYTPNSRSGAYSFAFFNRDVLINTVGGGLSESQPRCPNCYSFIGLSGAIEFRGDQPQAMTLLLRRGATVTDNFRIARE